VNIRLISLLPCVLLLSCQQSPEQNTPESRHFLKGDAFSLNRSITIPHLFSHVIIQYGDVIKLADLYAYETSCIVDQIALGPGLIQPQNYIVEKVTYNEEMYSDAGAVIRYFIEIYLSADDPQKNLVLTCQTLGNTMQHHSFPVSEVKQTTGDYFTF
jgi:hypothetical protein